MPASVPEQPSATLAVLGERLERRARLRLWGIEIEVWRLVDTVTVPDTAGSLSVASLFNSTLDVARVLDGALPSKLLPATDADPTTPTPLISPPVPVEPDYDLDYPEVLPAEVDASARLKHPKP